MGESSGRVTPFETIVEAAGDPMYTLDAAGRFDYVNDALVQQVTYSRADILGDPVARLLTDRAVRRCYDAIDSLHAGDADAETIEIQVTPGDGTRRNAEVTIALLPTESGDEGGDDGYRGTVGIVRDITDVRRSEQQLAVLERILRHNLRNELTVIAGRADHLQQELDDEALAEHAADALAAAERIRSLSEGVRDLHESVRPEESLSTHDLVAVVERAVETRVGTQPETTVRVDCPDSAVILATDAVALAVSELLQNAVDHGRPPVTISVADGDDGVTLRIADEGPGIPTSEREAVLTKTETPLAHGSGLGLWLVTWVLDSCGGDLSFETPADGGTVAIARFRTP
ncbi:ATP-binding protein [Haloarcula marina]|uniref:ATP-binding protein n=1 Tax=Haloarcula marina TaxID=2961574 RepID=UPI0020B74C1E|nr:PAS domain-containing sensor histidine kinase [Halomicroarcula marina]